jgi:hypothetical protein
MNWPAAKASRVLAAASPHWVVDQEAFGNDQDEIGPRMLARIAKRTGLTPGDL